MGSSRFEGFSSNFQGGIEKLSEESKEAMSEWAAVRPMQLGTPTSSTAESLVGLAFAIGATLKRAAPDNSELGDAVEGMLGIVAREAGQGKLISDDIAFSSGLPEGSGSFIILPPDSDQLPPTPDPKPGPDVEELIIIPPGGPSGGLKVCSQCGRPLP